MLAGSEGSVAPQDLAGTAVASGFKGGVAAGEDLGYGGYWGYPRYGYGLGWGFGFGIGLGFGS